MSELETAVAQLRTARAYVNDLLDDIDASMWYQQPQEGVTHVAWQVGHLAVAQYSLALRRTRGEQPEDETLITPDFRKRYGKDSIPSPLGQDNFSVAEVRQVADRVHAQVLAELPTMTAEQLAAASEPRHPMFRTKLGALLWCGQHEFIHAGQIALLRRLLGHDPLR